MKETSNLTLLLEGSEDGYLRVESAKWANRALFTRFVRVTIMLITFTGTAVNLFTLRPCPLTDSVSFA